MHSVPSDALSDKRGKTFLKVYTTEYDQFTAIPKGVRAYAMAVYMCLASHAHGDKDVAWPAHAVICDSTGLTKPTVLKALAALEASGHIRITARATAKGFQTSNRYTLLAVPEKAKDAGEDAGVNDVYRGGQSPLPQGSTTFTAGVNDVYTKQITESDQVNQIKERDAPLSLARHSPTGERAPAYIPPTCQSDNLIHARRQSDAQRERMRAERIAAATR
jgi:hypothetical protein